MSTTSTELANWLNGTAKGGPNKDGRYPLTYANGETHLVLCPAAQALTNEDDTSAPSQFAEDAQAAADVAESARDNAVAARTAAEAARDQAQTYKTDAASSASSASTKATNAASSASAADASASASATSATQSKTSATNASKSATAASNSASAASTSAATATTSMNLAQKWASEATDVEVSTGKYSAFHWATKAQDLVTGLLTYRGSWKASLGTYPASPHKGDFWKVSASGKVSGENYAVGDQIIYNGSSWDKIDNTESVSSVAGRVGAIKLYASDITDLPAVAVSGKYGDLKDLPALGTAAAKNIGDFAAASHTHDLKDIDHCDVSSAGAVSLYKWETQTGPEARLTLGAPGSLYFHLGNVDILRLDPDGTLHITGPIDASNVGTAAAKNVAYFATAAQGAKADTAVQPDALTKVATSGKYSDLSGTPSLGSAAYKATGDFATKSHRHAIGDVDHFTQGDDWCRWNQLPNTDTEGFSVRFASHSGGDNIYWRYNNSTIFSMKKNGDTSFFGDITSSANKMMISSRTGASLGATTASIGFYDDSTSWMLRCDVGTKLVDAYGDLRVRGEATATDFIISSDRRLKTHIRPRQRHPHIADKLSVKDYAREGVPEVGVIAQEVREYAPEHVMEDDEGMLSVKYTKLLLDCIADLAARVRELEASQ